MGLNFANPSPNTNNMGNVPRKKANIDNKPETELPVENAKTKAGYKVPQGKRAVKSPRAKANNVSFPFLLKRFNKEKRYFDIAKKPFSKISDL